MDDAKVPTPRLVAARLRLGSFLPSDQFPLWAAHWMTWGNDGPAVLRLAVLDANDTWLLRDALRDALIELDVLVESLRDASKLLYDDIAKGFLEGNLSERHVLAEVDSLVADSGHELEMYEQPLGGLFSLRDSIDTEWGPTEAALRAQVREACERQLGRSSEDHWYTLADGADRATVMAAFRGALIAQRPRLRHVDIDLISDEPWPEDVLWAVEVGKQQLEQRQRMRLLKWLVNKPSITFRVNPHDDGDFAVGVALAPFTIGGTGLDRRSRIIWDGNDTGTSAAFRLTETELVNLRAAIATAGGDPAALVALK